MRWIENERERERRIMAYSRPIEFRCNMTMCKHRAVYEVFDCGHILVGKYCKGCASMQVAIRTELERETRNRMMINSFKAKEKDNYEVNDVV